MTVKQYETLKSKVEEVWHTYPEWVKEWTRFRLQELLKEIK